MKSPPRPESRSGQSPRGTTHVRLDKSSPTPGNEITATFDFAEGMHSANQIYLAVLNFNFVTRAFCAT